MFSKIFDIKIEMRQYKIIMKEHFDYPIYIARQNNHEIVFENDFSGSIKDQLIQKYQTMNKFFQETQRVRMDHFPHHPSILSTRL